jgi:hypothetical protein
MDLRKADKIKIPSDVQAEADEMKRSAMERQDNKQGNAKG